MRRTYLSVVVLAMCGLAMACKSSKHKTVKRMPGTWQAQPVTIDGKNNDWPSPYPEYDDKAMLGYIVTNDKDNLYITVETGDLATQLKIIREGLTVWIDKTGGQDELIAINYPIPDAHDPERRTDAERPAPMHIQQSGGGNAPDKRRYELEDRVRRGLLKANEFSLQGFKSCNLQYPVTEPDSCGIQVRMALDADNELVWEAVVPFRTFYPKAHITAADKGKPISICFETTGTKRPPGQQGGGQSRGGMRPGPTFGVGGMGMGMQMGGRNRNSQSNTGGSDMMESLYKSTKTYKKTGIAFQAN